MGMKTSIAVAPQKTFTYTTNHFAAIKREGFMYFTNSLNGIVLFYKGKWLDYEMVREEIGEGKLPELTWEWV